jgi:Protein of unknown function (DUF3352)
MRRSLLLVVALVVAIGVVAAGCGGSSNSSGGGGSVPASASLVPAKAPVYVYANTDFGGSQWKNLDTLLALFPDEHQLTDAIQSKMLDAGVNWSDVKAALGPDTAAAVLAFTGAAKAALMTQPKDKAALDSLIQKLNKTGGSSTHSKQEIDGWTVVADSAATLAAISAASSGKGTSLADNEAFKSAFAALPSDALVKVYADGSAIAHEVQSRGGAAGGAAASLTTLKSVAASLAATDSGLELTAVATGPTGAKTFKPTLISDVPSGALVYIGFDNLGAQLAKVTSNPSLQQFTAGLAQLGITTDDLTKLLSGEGALYVRAGSPLPEVTLVLTESDAPGAVATIDKVTSQAAVALGTTVETVDVGGVQAKKLTIRNIPIYYAAVDGKLVVTNSEAGITGLSSSGDKLADDPVFKAASDAAGLPSDTTGLFYVNIKDTVPLIDSFASIAGQSLPPQATSNLEHVTSFIAYGSASGDTNTFKAFLEIK